MHYLYILQSEINGRFYIGVTNDIERRIGEHNSGLVRSTSPYCPWVVKRIEEFHTIDEAYQRERFIKAKHSKIIIEKIIAS